MGRDCGGGGLDGLLLVCGGGLFDCWLPGLGGLLLNCGGGLTLTSLLMLNWLLESVGCKPTGLLGGGLLGFPGGGGCLLGGGTLGFCGGMGGCGLLLFGCCLCGGTGLVKG